MDKIWLKNYQQGVPYEINPDSYASIPEIFDLSCQNYAKKIAYTNLGENLSYQKLQRHANNFASFLQSDCGVKKGDRVGIMMPNSLQYPICMFGALKTGAIIVNFNPLYTADEVSHQIKDSGIKVMVVMTNFANIVQESLKTTAVEYVIVTGFGDFMPWWKAIAMNFILKYLKKIVKPWHIAGAKLLPHVLTKGAKKTFQPVEIHNSDTAYIQYTGGTTGIAKGAMLTHRNMIANMEQANAWLKPVLTSDQELVVTALPLYHIFSLLANCLLFMKLGARNLLITNPRDIPGFISELAKYPFTAISGVNTLFNALLNNSKFVVLDFSYLRLTLGGGMAVQRSVAERWESITHNPLLEAYGLTESSPAVCISPMNLKHFNGSIGLPIPSAEVSIHDEEGVEVALGERGELWVRGPQVMKGYWNRPEDTAKVLTEDGWLKTGDIATVDDQGFVRIVDRVKDMIIVSGFNVYPNEIEDALAFHPGIKEVVVVGIPSNISGETVKAFIVPKDGVVLTKAEIMSFSREHLTGYKLPRQIEFRSSLPKSPVGKILRRVLRQEELSKMAEKQLQKKRL